MMKEQILEHQREQRTMTAAEICMWRNWLTHISLAKSKRVSLSGKLWVALHNTTHAITIQPSICTLGHLSKRNQNLCVHKNLYMNGHSNFTCKTENWK